LKRHRWFLWLCGSMRRRRDANLLFFLTTHL
jgi:hypothetical protein